MIPRKELTFKSFKVPKTRILQILSFSMSASERRFCRAFSIKSFVFNETVTSKIVLHDILLARSSNQNDGDGKR